MDDLLSNITVSPFLPLQSRIVNVVYLSDLGCTNVVSKGILLATPITARSTMITWTSLPIGADEVFYLQKSGNPINGWVTITKLTLSDSNFLDTNANNMMNRYDVEYYRILAPTSLLAIGDCKTEGYIDPYGSEIARRHSIQLRKGNNGNKTYVFIKIRSGPRCPDCWDEILQKRSRVNCASCFGTGYIVGYYNPIETYINFGPEAIAVSQEIDGPSTTPNAISCWTGNYPLLNIGDIVVEPGANRFWSVNRTSLTLHKRVVTRQEFQLNREDGDDPLLSLINRIPGGNTDGESIFKDDSKNSAGVHYSGTPEVLYQPQGVPVDF